VYDVAVLRLSIERTNEWKEPHANVPSREETKRTRRSECARVGVYRRCVSRETGFAVKCTVTNCLPIRPRHRFFFARFQSFQLEHSVTTKRTNAEGRMNSDEEQGDENVKQEVKPENHLNIKVRDTVRGISRRRVVH